MTKPKTPTVGEVDERGRVFKGWAIQWRGDYNGASWGYGPEGDSRADVIYRDRDEADGERVKQATEYKYMPHRLVRIWSRPSACGKVIDWEEHEVCRQSAGHEGECSPERGDGRPVQEPVAGLVVERVAGKWPGIMVGGSDTVTRLTKPSSCTVVLTDKSTEGGLCYAQHWDEYLRSGALRVVALPPPVVGMRVWTSEHREATVLRDDVDGRLFVRGDRGAETFVDEMPPWKPEHVVVLPPEPTDVPTVSGKRNLLDGPMSSDPETAFEQGWERGMVRGKYDGATRALDEVARQLRSLTSAIVAGETMLRSEALAVVETARKGVGQ